MGVLLKYIMETTYTAPFTRGEDNGSKRAVACYLQFHSTQLKPPSPCFLLHIVQGLCLLRGSRVVSPYLLPWCGPCTICSRCYTECNKEVVVAYRKRLNKKLRKMLRRKWIPELFPIALLIHGPIPLAERNTGSVHGKWAEPKQQHLLKVRDWYATNYIRYQDFDQRTAITLQAFMDEYTKWFYKQ